MADEKWIEGLHANLPIKEAAKLTLSVRLGAVRDRLPRAVFDADEDVENVHQLRVSTRRAAAALRLFADCLPARVHRKTRKALRALRRSAGDARDWDVFLTMLQKRRGIAKEQRGRDFLLGFAHGQRVQAQQHLHQAHEENAERFATCIVLVNESLANGSASKQTLSTLAVPMLTRLLSDFETAACADLQPYESLHQVRILGKQLRYAMEIFESCFSYEFRKRFYPAVVEMQDILGDANDSFTASERLNALRQHLLKTQPKQWPQLQAGIEALRAFHERRLPLQRKKFERWWRAWLKSRAETAFAELIRGT